MKNTDNSMRKVTFIYQIEDGKFGEEDVWASSNGSNYKVENIPFFTHLIFFHFSLN